MINWNDYPNFSEDEFKCTHCGKCEMKKAYMDKLQVLRIKYGRSMVITSGYRCPQHPIEAAKTRPGTHASGYAADINCDGASAHALVRIAFELGFTGIGINQKGAVHNRFIHLDILKEAPRPNMWSY